MIWAVLRLLSTDYLSHQMLRIGRADDMASGRDNVSHSVKHCITDIQSVSPQVQSNLALQASAWPSGRLLTQYYVTRYTATQQHILGPVGDFSHEATRCDKARQCLARSSGRLLTWYDTIRCHATQRDSYIDDIKIEADSYGAALEPSTMFLEEGDRRRLIEYMEVAGCKPKGCKRWPTLWRMPPALSGDRRRSEKDAQREET